MRRVLYYAEMLKAPHLLLPHLHQGRCGGHPRGQEAGVDVIAETCSHYLTRTKRKKRVRTAFSIS